MKHYEVKMMIGSGWLVYRVDAKTEMGARLKARRKAIKEYPDWHHIFTIVGIREF